MPLTDEWFPEERAFFDDPALLGAALCSRRAGKTRGIVKDLLRDALATPGYQALYLNTSRGEAERLVWHGGRGDGIATLVEKLKLNVRLNASKLTAYFPDTEAWIHIRGADDDAELRKALGTPYNKVYWDEAQKMPPKLAPSIREVFLPSMLDFRGQFRMTGTPVRNMSGMFWDVTRPEKEKRLPRWSVHHWTLQANPYWGRAKGNMVVWGHRDEVVSGPHEAGHLQAAVAGAREKMGTLAMQDLFGGPEVAPIDSPIMQREAFGRWVREDAAYVYAVHKVPHEKLLYAPHRTREDGFPDIPAALRDLPWDWRQGLFALGVDIGYYPDPFAFVLWGWHGHDAKLYEVASWKKTHLTSDEQNAALKAVREHLAIGIMVADAGGSVKPTIQGWSKEWVERYQQPIIEAQKAHKYPAIDIMNADIMRANVQFRENGPLFEEMSQLQWATIVSATGRQVEDPTLANDACDAGLYGHRHSYSFRWRPEDKAPTPGSPSAYLREEHELADNAEGHGDEEDSYGGYH